MVSRLASPEHPTFHVNSSKMTNRPRPSAVRATTDGGVLLSLLYGIELVSSAPHACVTRLAERLGFNHPAANQLHLHQRKPVRWVSVVVSNRSCAHRSSTMLIPKQKEDEHPRAPSSC